MFRKFLLLTFLFLSSCRNNNDIIIDTPASNDNSEQIIIEIKGAVQFPGLYAVKRGIMLFEVIEISGGLLNTADGEQLNMIQIFNDNTSIKIPYKNTLDQDSLLININRASLEELMKLTGIGKSKAQAIIDYRTKTPFNSIEDIMKVRGIGEEVFSQIKDDITI